MGRCHSFPPGMTPSRRTGSIRINLFRIETADQERSPPVSRVVTGSLPALCVQRMRAQVFSDLCPESGWGQALRQDTPSDQAEERRQAACSIACASPVSMMTSASSCAAIGRRSKPA